MHLFSKENIWSNPQQFPAYNPVIQTRTIILWTELFPKKRREKIQGENFNLSSSTVVFPQIQDFFEYSVFYSVSTRNPATPSNSTYRINSSTRNTTTTRLILCHPVQTSTRHLPATVPRASKQFYTAESSYKAPYSTSRLPVILGGRNSILHGSQHPRSPYSNSQASSTVLHYRILPGEIGFIPRVKYCISNTILRLVCYNLLVTRKLILSRVLVIPCEDTVHYLQSKLS